MSTMWSWSFLLMFLLSFVHGFIVTEVFQSVSDSKILSSWAGLSNQAGALSGSVITFIIVQMGLFKKAWWVKEDVRGGIIKIYTLVVINLEKYEPCIWELINNIHIVVEIVINKWLIP